MILRERQLIVYELKGFYFEYTDEKAYEAQLIIFLLDYDR
jgi:hypothetical protein